MTMGEDVAQPQYGEMERIEFQGRDRGVFENGLPFRQERVLDQ